MEVEDSVVRVFGRCLRDQQIGLGELAVDQGIGLAFEDFIDYQWFAVSLYLDFVEDAEFGSVAFAQLGHHMLADD